MAEDLLQFALLALSSIVIIVNPLSATLVYVSLTPSSDAAAKAQIAKEACRYAFGILLIFALLGGIILEIFGITLEAFRIGGGILLFLIGMEMVYARVSRSKLTATEKYEGLETEDVAVMPLALPMISGPGAITTTIVLMNESGGNLIEIAMVIAFIAIAIGITYVMMRNSDLIVARVGERESRAINRLMGILLIAIAVQFVINGLRIAFPVLGG
ncbi:MAG: MarC family protein [Methanoregulaceae archaeon]|nr:MarC family protein [Methanoregulaceae archaeon]